MELLVYILRSTLLLIIDVLQIAMLIRAVFSWIDPEGGSRISAFLYMLTEPVILPVRAICVKNNWFQGTPIDIPYLITVLLLSLLQLVIRII